MSVFVFQKYHICAYRPTGIIRIIPPYYCSWLLYHISYQKRTKCREKERCKDFPCDQCCGKTHFNQGSGFNFCQIFFLEHCQKLQKSIHWHNLSPRCIDSCGIFENGGSSQSVVYFSFFISGFEIRQISRTVSCQGTQ